MSGLAGGVDDTSPLLLIVPMSRLGKDVSVELLEERSGVEVDRRHRVLVLHLKDMGHEVNVGLSCRLEPNADASVVGCVVRPHE